MTLALTGAPDSHREPVFWCAQMVLGALNALTCFFLSVSYSFRDFCEDFGCFRRSFAGRGPENPRGRPAPMDDLLLDKTLIRFRDHAI